MNPQEQLLQQAQLDEIERLEKHVAKELQCNPAPEQERTGVRCVRLPGLPTETVVSALIGRCESIGLRASLSTSGEWGPGINLVLQSF